MAGVSRPRHRFWATLGCTVLTTLAAGFGWAEPLQAQVNPLPLRRSFPAPGHYIPPGGHSRRVVSSHPMTAPAMAEMPVAGELDTLEGDSLVPELMEDIGVVSDAAGPVPHAGCPGCAECGAPAMDWMTPCQSQTWIKLDYLAWWQKAGNLPPLVTTSPTTTPRDEAGVLGLPSTRVIYGDGPVDDNLLHGGRIQFGHWMDPAQQRAWALEYFGFGQLSSDFHADSNDTEILARPFFNTLLNEQDSLLLSYPDELSGSIAVSNESSLQSWAAFMQFQRCQTCQVRIDSVLGYRYFGYDESLLIQNDLEFIDPSGTTVVGTTIAQEDLFDVENNFHGGEIGFLGRSEMGSYFLDLGAKLALGNMQRKVQVNGHSVTTVPNTDSVTTEGGLLTQPSNIGDVTDNAFSLVPQFTAGIGWHVTPRMTFNCGYTFLYLTNVIRPGDLIDPDVNLSQQTSDPRGTLQPALTLQDTDMWLQGLNLGLDWRY